MCGIAGIISLNKENSSNVSIIKKMTDTMAHRGPDADGFFNDNFVSFGHRRLSIIDLSANANQPLYDTSGNFVIIFNGEIYNYKEVKAKLPHYNFTTTSDTEVVLAAYITWGKDALQHLLGMFAFAIYNKNNQEVFVARDRLGVKPVYYYSDANYFIFASELRTVLSSGLIERKVNSQALHGYFSTQSFAAPQTIIQNVNQLKAGYCITITSAAVQQYQYWDINKPKKKFEFETKAQTQAQVKKLLEQSVERRLVADVPVAAFLSGGIDSSAIVGIMASYINKPETFNIAFEEKEFDESYYAELVAKKFNTNHHKLILKPQDFLDELPNALKAMDIPSGDGVNSYVVSKAIVSKGIKVAMSGVGGDELFAGYPSFLQWHKLNKHKWIWSIPTTLRNAGSICIPSTSKFSRIKKLLQQKNLDINSFYPLVREVMSNESIASLLNQNKNYIEELNVSNNFPLLSQFSIAELVGYTHHTLLKDTDQFSMAQSLEVREPFFDHELIEYVLQIPDIYKFPNYPKQLLVESLGDLLPPEIVHRKKQGFTFPWKHWLKNELRQFCESNIDSFSKRAFVNEKFCKQVWQSFLSNESTIRWSEIWIIVVLENWLQQNFD
ncbi:MAG: asparagine synthase (glutamine-hydrolyzing) [Chitinophagaceae bacterium]